MTLSKEELGLSHYVLRFSTERNHEGLYYPRQLSIEEMEVGVSINGKIKACVKDDKYVESEIELSTEEKAFMLKSIDRPLTVDEAEIRASLKAKLS